MPHTVAIPVNGEALTPDPLGGAYWAREEVLIVSDVHFEKGSSFAARGALLPPYDTRTTLTRLEGVMRRYNPKRVISLGNHDPAPPVRFPCCRAGMLEIGRETVARSASEEALKAVSEEIIETAMG